MNKPSHPVISDDLTAPFYETDAYGWAMAQARLIRDGRLDGIDWRNVAEEIESVGRSEQDKAESALRVLMAHILKWKLQPERRGRSWALTIAEQRLRYDRQLRGNPSLKPLTEEMRDAAFRRSRIEVAREMDVPLRTLPETPPAWEVILDESFDVDA